jgi:hypothetical protein
MTWEKVNKYLYCFKRIYFYFSYVHLTIQFYKKDIMFLRLKNKKVSYKIEVSKKKLIGLTLFGHFGHKNDFDQIGISLKMPNSRPLIFRILSLRPTKKNSILLAFYPKGTL